MRFCEAAGSDATSGVAVGEGLSCAVDFVSGHEGHEAVGDSESSAAEAPEQSDDPELLVFGLFDEEGGEHGANDPACEGSDECCDGDPEDSWQQGFWEPLGGWEGKLVSCIPTTYEGDDGEQLADEAFGPSGDDAGEHPAGCEDERPVREGWDNGVLHGKGGLVRLACGGWLSGRCSRIGRVAAGGGRRG